MNLHWLTFALVQIRTLSHLHVQRYSITKITHIVVKNRLSHALIYLRVDLGSVLESELGQKWRYGALKACITKTSLM